MKSLSNVQLFATLWTVAYQTPLSMGFSRQDTGVGCHFLLQCMKLKVKVKLLSRVRIFATPWTAAYQAPLSIGFSRQEYWSGVPLPSPMTNLDIILKSRDITLSTKVSLVKAMVFPVVMYGCESWTIKKAE